MEEALWGRSGKRESRWRTTLGSIHEPGLVSILNRSWGHVQLEGNGSAVCLTYDFDDHTKWNSASSAQSIKEEQTMNCRPRVSTD